MFTIICLFAICLHILDSRFEMSSFKGNLKESQRAIQLLKQREKERQEIEFQKKKLEAELRVGELTNKFTVHHETMESQLKTDTVRPVF